VEEVNLADISPVVEKYRGRQDGLISALQETQDIYGYLPETALCHLSRELNVAMSKVYSVATFYAQFYLHRRGRNIVRVCRGTACHVRGGKAVLSSIENRLGIKDSQTTGDYKFTLETVACLGACAMGPVIMVGEKYYGKMTPAKIEALLDTF